MKRIIFGLLVFCITLFLTGLARAEKMRIGFLEQIDATIDVPDAIKQNLKDAIRLSLVNSGKFEVVDRNQKDINRLFEEMKFSEERVGRVDANDPKKAEFGKLAGMEYMALVTINDFFTGEEASKFQATSPGNKVVVRIGVNLRLLNASTGRIQLEKSVSAKKLSVAKASGGQPDVLDMELVNKVIKALAEKTVRQVMDEAYPILILERSGNIAFVNRGKDSGIAVGDEMEVFIIKKVIDEGVQETVDIARPVGKVKVTNISEKTAQVEILEDFGIAKECVLKPMNQERAAADVTKSIDKKMQTDDW